MGYVGIPSAALFADLEGFNVVGIQRRSKRSGWKIDYLNQGKNPIKGEEPGLDELIKKVVREGKLLVTDDISFYYEADVILIDVQTPVGENHTPKYDSLESVSHDVGKNIKNGVLIGIESTVAPGTTLNVVKPILEEASGMKAGTDFNLIFSYERVMVGRLLYNLKFMPRIVGGFTNKCTERGVELYKKITKTEVYGTDCLTAEIAKVVENTYRDVNIAFANEVALICESMGVNFHDVRKFVNSLPFDSSDPSRNPYRMLMIPGAGVGGHCLPKDPWLLNYGVNNFGKNKVDTNIIRESRRINDMMPRHMFELIKNGLSIHKKILKDSKITLLGYAFIGDSDDTRNTPAKPLYDLLSSEKSKVIVHDPYVQCIESLVHTYDLKEALKDSDCLAIVTNHNEYYGIDLEWTKMQMRTPVIIDGRNVIDPKKAEEYGFTFKGVGIG
jgi:UDP-N-acetyl-D-mannosaminuronic acid dehydrogenase